MLVTSFLIQRNGHTTRNVDDYFRHFKDIADLRLPTVCYMDKSITKMPFNLPDTVHLVPISIADLETYHILDFPNQNICIGDNPNKNTLDFHTIMNSKTELCVRAMKEFDLGSAAWVDFGLSHVIKNKQNLRYLENIDKLPKGIHIPGCWPMRTNHFNPISWRFCGGVVVSDVESMTLFHSICQSVLKKIRPVVTWEVNIWAVVESLGFPVNWYKADHDDSIITSLLEIK